MWNSLFNKASAHSPRRLPAAIWIFNILRKKL